MMWLCCQAFFINQPQNICIYHSTQVTKAEQDSTADAATGFFLREEGEGTAGYCGTTVTLN